MSALEPGEACRDCLRRSWLLAALAAHIERGASHGPGRRVAEILALPDEDLLAAVAPKLAGKIQADLNRVGEPGMRRSLAEAGCWSVCRHRADFPGGLRDLGDAPVALFGRGQRELLADLTTGRAVTVVGSRRATAYGLGVARDLGRELAMAGLTVISGLAIGIDGAAHAGALEAGLSCAVLGCGVDLIYPARHRALYRRLRERGLILSELPVGTAAWRWTFPARNRLMAALAGITVVVEAAERSGSLITATIAQDLGRDLGAVPGPVTSRSSAGPNALLGQGACLVRSAQDVLDALLGAGAVPLWRAGPRLDRDLASALECFERRGGDWDAIQTDLGRRGIEAAAALAQLELLGYLHCSPLGRWTRTTLPTPS